MMPDAEWILEYRERRYQCVKKAVSKLKGRTFTARSIIPRVKKETWSYFRWNVSVQTVAGALTRLKREGFVEIVGYESIKGRNKRYPSSLYRAVDLSFEEE